MRDRTLNNRSLRERDRRAEYVAAATGGVGAIVLLGYYGLAEKP